MRKKQKKQTKSLREATRKHEKWLKSMGAHKDQRKYSNSNKETRITVSRVSESINDTVDTSKWSHGTKKAVMRYSGERRLLGIATLHKSNLVPVFEKEDLQAIGKMRR